MMIALGSLRASRAGDDPVAHWGLIPLFAGLLILGGCMLYTRSVRKAPPSSQRFRGRTVVLILTAGFETLQLLVQTNND
jgi:hypothetical protein